ncbi:MAG: signal peptidase II, partial [Parcubacteria group bacterium]
MIVVGKIFRRIALLDFSVLLLVGFDQWVKFVVSKQGGFFIWPDFLDIGFYQNYGIAFGIPLPLYLIYPLIAVSLVLIGWRYRQKLGQGDIWIWLACWLIFAGA